ncbi:LytTR family DNA-binding domain-containing protein [Winogradskyella sp.]|uniref:LytTR family DNA-binding domain-containing protein n=1 Tax=Winogradskyella sp. TaxID=1883156 RepID=UPI001B0B8D95|nr:LytTR family DNA-binding domain-containing protein [Winogradskyella sp.]MBO6880251.1 LytTR family transcriptional regulator [Winogradskyella sp.]
MKQNYPFDPKLEHHILIGLLLALWIFIFLYFTEPLDVSEFSNAEKLIYLPGYGLVGGLCYFLFLPLQNFLFKKSDKQWFLLNEILLLLSFSIISIIIARSYYLYVVMVGEQNPYSFSYMLLAIFLPALATILPIIIVARFAFGKYQEKQLEDQKIEIKGEGNYEGLRLQLKNIVSIQSSDNYIEVFHISGNDLKKTLIRNKLSVIDDEIEELLRTHRSHLINPFHFQQWKTENGKHFLVLTFNIEVPVSKTYLSSSKSLINSATN